MKTYELIFEDESKGVFRVSLVKDPAVEATLIKFSAETTEVLHFADEEKRVIYAVAMRPNKLIFRKNVSKIPNVVEPANVYYTAETIERLQQNYFRNNGNSGTNVNHADDNTNGIFPFENWTVLDPKADKSTLMGLQTIKGDWVMGFKIDNDNVWQDCKAGKLDGLSIEARLGFKESNINFNIETPMTDKKKSFWAKFMKFAEDAMGEDDDQAKEIATGMFATSTEVGSIVSDKDGNPAANAEFEVDGTKYKTDDKGAILAPEVEVEAVEDEETPEQLKTKVADLEKEVADLKEEKQKWEAEKTKSETDLQTMKTEKETAETALTTMKTEKEKAEADFLKFKKENTPAKKIDNNPTEVHMGTEDKKYEDMTNFEKLKFNREKLG